MKKILIIIRIILIVTIYNKEKEEITIPKESIRIRIIANSNNIDDQMLKLKVKKNIESKLYTKLNNINDIDNARNIINENIKELEKTVLATTNSENFSINYGNNYFPEKEYKGITYKEGYYESLVIKLGEASGNNWWCVLFPPLCMIETKKNKLDKNEYKSKVLEILKEYK